MQFDLDSLFMPGMLIFFATAGVSLKVTRSVIFSILAAFVKSGVFLLYFGVLFDGTFTFLDDWQYLEIGQIYYNLNVGITNLMENLEAVKESNGGEHILYSIYNVYAFRLFGIGYYAPVALNILLTILIAWFGANLAAIEFGFIDRWKKMFFAFLLFHPDIFAWSNIMNGKDTLVLLLHILLLSAVSMYFRGRVLVALVLFFVVSMVLLNLRFYVPVLFAFAFAANLLFMEKTPNNLRILFSGFSVLLVGSLLKDFELPKMLAMIQADSLNPFYGFFSFILTPVPFGTEEHYRFLDISALIHWLLIPFVIIGVIIMLQKSSNFARFFLLYLLVFVALYSCYAELSGPRHRVQTDFAWAVLQFLGLKPFLYRILRPLFHSKSKQGAC